MKQIILLFLVAGIWGTKANAQAPIIQWQKAMGGSALDQSTSICRTNDGGYVTAGYTRSNDGDIQGNNHGGFDYWVVKTDSTGKMLWTNLYGGSLDDYATSVIATTDGGYMVAGYSNSNDGDITNNHNGSIDYWLVKLDAEGHLMWQRSLGGSLDDYASSVIQTSDGGYAVCGYTNSNDGDVNGNHGSNDYWVVKLDNVGNIQWQKAMGGTGLDNAMEMHQTSEGGYIVIGYSNSLDGDVTGNHGGSFDYWMTKMDANGNLLWQKSLGGSDDDQGAAVRQTDDGGYLVAGYSKSSDGDVTTGHTNRGYDYWIVKTDASGSIQWQNIYGGTRDDYATSMCQSGGAYVIAGYSNSIDGDVQGNHGIYDYWMIMINPADGSMYWQKTLGGSGDDRATCVQTTLDGGYVVTGYTSSDDYDVTNSHSPGIPDYWVVKLDAQKVPPPIVTGVAGVVNANDIVLYSNPSYGMLNFLLPVSEGNYNFVLIDMSGKRILTERILDNRIDASIINKGFYFYEILSDQNEILTTGKVILR
ncbi:T9SS type A sorting domain-containing protein [Taibaiella soli]|uniref:T9SS C-terminal target domain-containing protein n=1 Tax=Taibaiella soli TaxID=1649169 RepID=A0A2W2BV92_9BACT|nr:T9SS type A sorting domain-containing protein [Taibaiella soli]PZF71723.1 T9SS C-terminal target domain-containing protein [Taibaiella soli]